MSVARCLSRSEAAHARPGRQTQTSIPPSGACTSHGSEQVAVATPLMQVWAHGHALVCVLAHTCPSHAPTRAAPRLFPCRHVESTAWRRSGDACRSTAPEAPQASPRGPWALAPASLTSQSCACSESRTVCGTSESGTIGQITCEHFLGVCGLG